MSHSFDAFVLLISVHSEISIYHVPTIIIHTNIHLKKLVDSIYHLLQKQLLLNYEVSVFYLMVDYHLN